ncbi:unnamed protein product [Soboliphyme baturini]|uniref:PRKCSH_1 domain-containing protein n=1 Tax=Soboliphyme baturini TaxID=241478 RepID=A0A183IWR1_9BILA|nr:unnamed protein product [Soboliphyme baturini]
MAVRLTTKTYANGGGTVTSDCDGSSSLDSLTYCGSSSIDECDMKGLHEYESNLEKYKGASFVRVCFFTKD